MVFAKERREGEIQRQQTAILLSCITRRVIDPASLKPRENTGKRIPWSQHPGRAALYQAAEAAAARK